MATNSSIEWTDTTWNPVVGCRSYSSGCANCYAETMSVRLAGMATADTKAGRKPSRKSHYLNVIQDGGWRGNVELVPEALSDPFGWRKPRRVFVNSMSDLFYGDAKDEAACKSKGIPSQPVPFEFIDKVFAVMALTPQHTYQILTKRPARMAEYLNRPMGQMHGGMAYANVMLQVDRLRGDGRGFINGAMIGVGWPLRNVWLGTSVENQKTADERIPHLLKCPAAMRFLSCEPLLGAVDLSIAHCLKGSKHCELCEVNPSKINWVIVGGESGHGARPMDIGWARSIVQQCKASGVPCFVKQLGAKPVGTIDEITGGEDPDEDNIDDYKLEDSKGGDMSEWPADLRVREFPVSLASTKQEQERA